MPRINRKVRVRPQNRVTRAQILELLLGPNGASVFASPADAAALWATVQLQYSPAFAARWHAAGNAGKRFAEIAAEYARRVVDGEIEACRWTRLACKRHLNNLERAEAGEGKYVFDVAKAERACRFLELLPHVKGGWAATAELMVLQAWQVFIVCSVFGWVKRESGMRRFSISYIEVPRKNGKSFLAAGIGLYLCFCDAEHGAEVYSGATTEKQAHEVFLPARQMMERSSELAQALGVLPATKRIGRPEDGSRFEVVIGKPGDGASPHCGIVDEYHEHDSDSLVDTLRTGMGARRQPLLFIITTAGDNTAGPCKLLQADVCKILEGADRDEVFGIVYAIDAGDSWTAVGSLAKANPNLDVSVFRDFLVAEQQAAIVNARKQGVFQTKHLDVWVGAVASYFDLHRWKELADPALRAEHFLGERCVVAVDLSTKRDFTARVILFVKQIGGKNHYYAFPRFYLPQAQIDRPECPHYKEWAADGAIRVHEGGIIDFEAVAEETVQDVTEYQALDFVYDSWNSSALQPVGKRTRAEISEVPQLPKFLSPPMKELDALIASGCIHHDGNPILTWMMGNVMAREDLNENVLPRKERGREENKIDGAVALIMAISRACQAEEDTITYTGLRSVG